MLPFVKSVTDFAHRHRNKILIGSVVAVAVSVYVGYQWSSSCSEADEQEQDKPMTGQIKLFAESPQSRKPGNRSRLLLKIRRQFDLASNQFLPTLREKIVDAVDINGTVRHIKELRAQSSSSEDRKELECRLWDEIKIASFTMLIVTSYMLSAVCTLLRVQLHILARTMYNSLEVDENSPIRAEGIYSEMNSSMFKMLLEKTYMQLLGPGLRSFCAVVKQLVAVNLACWTVKDKVTVEFDELTEMISYIRRGLEEDLPSTVKTIFIPPEENNVAPAGPDAVIENVESTSMPTTVQQLLDQTWDLIESPSFLSVYPEAVDTCFRLACDDLYRVAFAPDQAASKSFLLSPSLSRNNSKNNRGDLNSLNASGTTAVGGTGNIGDMAVMADGSAIPAYQRTPPLASLLPQVKAAALRLLPSEALAHSPAQSSFLTSELSEISAGPYLEAFCMAIFDTPPQDK